MPRAIHVQMGGALRHRRGDEPSPRTRYPLIRSAARAALRAEDVRHAQISVTLLDDDAIADLNHRYIGHDGPTDVIAFPLFEEGEAPVGDVYIGWDQVRRNADAGRIPLEEELARVTVHGILHVLGHEHDHGAARTRGPMWQLQERVVGALLSEG
jgi:probable rRNA maturation factor